MRVRRLVPLAVWLFACGPVLSVVNTIDDVPSASLLLPYFEVDIAHADGVNTVFSINNAAPTAVLAHVTLWTDQSVPALNFDVYLTGYDVQTISLREIFVDGRLPGTATDGHDPKDTISPHGPVSEDVDFPSCSGENNNNSDPALSIALRAHLDAWFQGNQSPATGNCAGSKTQDNILRGYVTIDTVNACNLFFPSDWAFYAPFLTDQNVLWGDYFYLNPGGNTAQGDTLVHIEACPSCFSPGEHTFYGRYNAASAADGREPLPIAWAARYGVLDGGTDLLVWREANASAGSYSCSLAGPPSWYPLGLLQVVIFDEDEQVVTFEGGLWPSDPAGQEISVIPNEAGRIDVAADLLTPFERGWVFLSLSHDHVDPSYGDVVAQSWVSVAAGGESGFGVGYRAIQVSRPEMCHCWQDCTGWMEGIQRSPQEVDDCAQACVMGNPNCVGIGTTLILGY